MSALLQLTCFQMLIYAGMWIAGWVIVGEERRAVLHWLGFNLLLAVGLGLVSLRPTGDPWLTVVLANLVLAGAFLLLYRGGALFLRLPTRDVEATMLMLSCAAFAVWAGPVPTRPGWIHPGAATAALIGWVLLAASWRSRGALAEQFGPRTAWVALAPQVVYGIVQGIRAWQIFTLDASAVQLQTQSVSNQALVYVSMLSAAVFNLVFMFLIVLRLMGRLTYMVEHDGLTGLLNRRAIETLLNASGRAGGAWGSPSPSWRWTWTTSSRSTTAGATPPGMRCCAAPRRCCAARCARWTAWAAWVGRSSWCSGPVARQRRPPTWPSACAAR